MLQCPPWSPAYDFSEVSNLVQNVWHKYVCFKKCLEEGYIKLSAYVVGPIQNSNQTYSKHKFKVLTAMLFTECLLIDCDKGKLYLTNIWRTDWTGLVWVWSQVCFWWLCAHLGSIVMDLRKCTQGCSWGEGGVVQPPQLAEAKEWQNEYFK